jgi:hypothetical protein
MQDILNGWAIILDGVECFYSSLTETQTNFFIKILHKK